MKARLGYRWRRLGLSRSDLEVSHAALDRFDGGPALGHLRVVLIVAGLLTARDETLARLDIGWRSRSPPSRLHPDRRVVEAFATWRVVRRQRQRADRGDTSSTKMARRQIDCATTFQEFPGARDRALFVA